MENLIIDALIEILLRIRKCEDKEKRQRALKLFYTLLGILLEV